MLDKVFNPFFTSKGPGKGTGLGLSMVYGFIKQSAGHIKIYSEEGYGTTIKMYLPPGTGASLVHEAHGPSRRSKAGHETILVVEDDRLVREYVLTQLARALGYVTLDAGKRRRSACHRQGRARLRSTVHRRHHAGHDERPPSSPTPSPSSGRT